MNNAFNRFFYCLINYPKILTFFIVSILLFAPQSYSAQVTLEWGKSPSPNIAGYRVYYGIGSLNYSTVLDVGDNTSCVISGLLDNRTYYFAATAYDTSNYESVFSNEVNFNSATGTGGSVDAFVSRFYRQCLGRYPETEGLNYYTDRLMAGVASGASVARNFIYSPEFLNRNTTNEEFLTIMYRAFFDREPDAGGWSFYLNKLNNGVGRGTVFYGFIYSPEFENLCNRFGIIPYF